MSLEVERSSACQASFVFAFEVGKRNRNSSGKVGSLPLAFHFSTVVAAVGMWESRSDFQGRWAPRETWCWFSWASTARHFHSRLSCRSRLLETGEQLPFRLLHAARCFRVAARLAYG